MISKDVTKMDIQATKLALLKIILENDNSEFLQKLSDFIKSEKSDFWDDLTQAEQQNIKKGIEELNEGNKVSFDSFLEKIS